LLEVVSRMMAFSGLGVQGQEVLELSLEFQVEDVLGATATLRGILLIEVLV
jgi:hypothetical protein